MLVILHAACVRIVFQSNFEKSSICKRFGARVTNYYNIIYTGSGGGGGGGGGRVTETRRGNKDEDRDDVRAYIIYISYVIYLLLLGT